MNKLYRILLLAFLVRLILAPFFSDDFNYWALRVFTNILIEGFNPWSVVYHDPTLYWINPWRYPPLMIFFVLPATLAYTYTKNALLFLYLIKLPTILCSLITTLLLYKISCLLTNGDDKKATRVATFYAFNPLIIFLDGTVWGVLDAIPVMFSIASLYFFLMQENDNHIKTSALLLGCGIATKLYPLFILPVFLVKLRRPKKILTFTIYSLIPLVLFSIPFLLWDYKAYLDVLLIHNIGGYHPLFPALHPSVQSLWEKIVYFLPSTILLIVAYKTNTSIIINIVLSLLALYFAMGGGIGSYSLWVVPFGLLLMISNDSSAQKVGKFFSFFPLPYVVIGSLINGPYNNVEGTTGIFYFTYHLLRMKIVIFRTWEIISDFYPILITLGTLFILLAFIYSVRIRDLTFEVPKGSKRENKKASFDNLIFKRKCFAKYASLIITIFIIHIVIFSTFSIELSENMPVITSSEFMFFDDFSTSLLNYQWSFGGEGTYAINLQQSPSYIIINSSGIPYNRAYIYRGWGPIWQGFTPSNNAFVEFRFKFVNLLKNSHTLIISRSNGGWFGVTIHDKSPHFIYFDDISNTPMVIAPADNEWHGFKIIYRSGDRYIYFDGTYIGKYEGEESFSFLFLGNPDTTPGLGGTCMYDWVKVIIKDFPVKYQNKGAIISALLLPLAIMLVLLYKSHKLYLKIARVSAQRA